MRPGRQMAAGECARSGGVPDCYSLALQLNIHCTPNLSTSEPW